MKKSPTAFRTISEVSDELEVQQHVLRFWETKFSQIRPMKRGGGRRYYRPEDLTLLLGIRDLLYVDGYTIRGVQKLLRERGVRVLVERAAGGGPMGPVDGKTDVADSANGDGAAAPATGALDNLRRTQLKAVIAELEDLHRLLKSVL